MRLGAFRQIVSMPSVILPVAGTVENYDPLISDGYDGKTGSDSQAEGCLAFFKYVMVDGRRLTVVGVILDQGEGAATAVVLGAAAASVQRLITSVTPSIRSRTIVPADTAVMVASSADGQRVHAVTGRPLSVIGWGGIRERLAIRLRSLKTDHLSTGERVGEMVLAGNLRTAAGEPARTMVRASTTLSAPGIFWRLEHLL
jgi:hypothetical protein